MARVSGAKVLSSRKNDREEKMRTPSYSLVYQMIWITNSNAESVGGWFKNSFRRMQFQLILFPESLSMKFAKKKLAFYGELNKKIKYIIIYHHFLFSWKFNRSYTSRILYAKCDTKTWNFLIFLKIKYL